MDWGHVLVVGIVFAVVVGVGALVVDVQNEALGGGDVDLMGFGSCPELFLGVSGGVFFILVWFYNRLSREDGEV